MFPNKNLPLTRSLIYQDNRITPTNNHQVILFKNKVILKIYYCSYS